MSNCSFIDYVQISPNKTNIRNNKIKKITPHHVAGDLSVEAIGNVFASTDAQASANYGIGTDGRVGMYVEEKDRAWTSSNADNDNQAITIEVANDGGAPDWHVSDKALNRLVDLCVDICKRNSIDKLIYTGDANGTLTAHNMFAPTTCPGPYLQSKFPWIAEQVNKRLGCSKTLYRVRKNWQDSASQVGAYANIDNAKKACDSAGKAYSVFDEKGNAIYPDAGYRVKVMVSALNIRSGPGTQYKINGCITDCGVYTIVETKGNWGKLLSEAGWICLDYTARI